MDVKEAILQAGTSLLKEHGIAALTQPKVAKAAGIKQSHLTYYFPKRSDLLLGVAERTIADVLTAMQTRMEQHHTQTAFTETLAQAMIEGMPPRIMLGLIVAADGDPSLRPALQQLIEKVRGQVANLLEKAGLASDAEAVLLFHATIVGLAVLHDAQRTTHSAKEINIGMNGLLRCFGEPGNAASGRADR